MYDDTVFMFGAQHYDPVILYCSVVSIIIVPTTMFINVMSMPNRRFERISGKPPTKEKRFLYFVAEYLNATVFFTDSNELITERSKSKKLFSTIFKSLFLTMLKLVMVFQIGKSIGFYYVFSLAKTFILFAEGCGESLNYILDARNVTSTYAKCKFYSLAVVILVGVLTVPFFFFFEADRTPEFEYFGFYNVPAREIVAYFNEFFGGILATISVLAIVVRVSKCLCCRKTTAAE